MASAESSDPIYTVFIRLPFPRGDFVDPPRVDWDSTKDKTLWKIISKGSKNSDVDWHALAEKFDVSLPFLLQQAAWLYERELSKVRAQMRKVGASKGSASPLLGSDSAGGESMRRTGSGGGGPRTQSSLSIRKDSAFLQNDAVVPNPPGRNPLSRNLSSTNTAQMTNSRGITQISPRFQKSALNRPPSPSAKTPAPRQRSVSPAASFSSSEASSDVELPTKSRLLRRPPRFSDNRMNRSEDADDDDDAPAFMDFSTAVGHDPSATLRLDGKHQQRMVTKKNEAPLVQSQTSDSSNSSVPATKPAQNDVKRPFGVGHGPLSPRRTAELAGRTTAKGKSRESDGSPSMGSSFSDLDDASITQSAMEEALASGMRQGTMASKISHFGQAFARSRYGGGQ